MQAVIRNQANLPIRQSIIKARVDNLPRKDANRWSAVCQSNWFVKQPRKLFVEKTRRWSCWNLRSFQFFLTGQRKGTVQGLNFRQIPGMRPFPVLFLTSLLFGPVALRIEILNCTCYPQENGYRVIGGGYAISCSPGFHSNRLFPNAGKKITNQNAFPWQVYSWYSYIPIPRLSNLFIK